MGSPGVERRARVAEGRALGLGSVRAVPVEPACGPGQRVVEEPWVGRRVKQSRIAEGFEKFVDRRVDERAYGGAGKVEQLSSREESVIYFLLIGNSRVVKSCAEYFLCCSNG